MKDESGYAFPTHGSMGEVVQTGMTLRDYFAAKAMQAIIGMMQHNSNGDFVSKNDGLLQNWKAPEFVSKTAYTIADAMIKERGE